MLSLASLFHRVLGRQVLPEMAGIGPAQLSAIYLDPTSRPTERLLDLATRAAMNARDEDLREISE